MHTLNILFASTKAPGGIDKHTLYTLYTDKMHTVCTQQTDQMQTKCIYFECIQIANLAY